MTTSCPGLVCARELLSVRPSSILIGQVDALATSGSRVAATFGIFPTQLLLALGTAHQVVLRRRQRAAGAPR